MRKDLLREPWKRRSKSPRHKKRFRVYIFNEKGLAIRQSPFFCCIIYGVLVIKKSTRRTIPYV